MTGRLNPKQLRAKRARKAKKQGKPVKAMDDSHTIREREGWGGTKGDGGTVFADDSGVTRSFNRATTPH